MTVVVCMIQKITYKTTVKVQECWIAQFSCCQSLPSFEVLWSMRPIAVSKMGHSGRTLNSCFTSKCEAVVKWHCQDNFQSLSSQKQKTITCSRKYLSDLNKYNLVLLICFWQ